MSSLEIGSWIWTGIKWILHVTIPETVHAITKIHIVCKVTICFIWYNSITKTYQAILQTIIIRSEQAPESINILSEIDITDFEGRSVAINTVW